MPQFSQGALERRQQQGAQIGQGGLAGIRSGAFNINRPAPQPTPGAPQGLPGQESSGGPSPVAMPQDIGAQPPPVPGVSGITPGAIERRLGVLPASMQALGGAPQPPSDAARSILQHQPNELGPSRFQVNSPVAAIQNLLQQIRSQRGSE